MKVCMLVHQNYFQDERVRRYATTLVEQGDLVDVICPRHSQYAMRESHGSVNVITIPLMHHSGAHILALFIEYFIALIFYFFILSFRQFTQHYSIIHVHNMPDLLVFAALVPKLLGAKIILDIHDPMPEFYQTKFRKDEDAFPIKIFRIEEKLSIRLTNAVITANENFRTNLITRGVPTAKITTIRNFPDRQAYNPNLFPKKDETGEIIAIYPGTIAPRYGLDVALRGLALVDKQYPQVKLKIIGAETPHKQELRELAASLGISDKVEFAPVVASDKVAGLIAQADIGIYPALPDAHMDIAIPSKVLEFAVMGLPVIASDLKVIRQLFPDDLAYIFAPGNAEGFAVQLASVINNKGDLNDKLARVSQELLPYWDWQIEQNKYTQLLAYLVTK